MITEDFRPSNFSELKGQEFVKTMLTQIIKNPENSPRSLIFEGEFGTGKTTCARIFARSLNCLKKTSSGASCGACEVCLSDLKTVPYYVEYDSSIVGSVDQIRGIREHLLYEIPNSYRIVVFDEAHLISRQAQNALLKETENTPQKVFFIFCTTEVRSIIPTIRSRSLEVRFSSISEEDIRESLISIAKKIKVEIPESVLSLIIVRANGHMRDAHKLLNQYLLIGEEDFLSFHFSTDILWLYLFASIVKQDDSIFTKTLAKLGTVPLLYLKEDYQRYVSSLIERFLFSKLSDQEKKFFSLLGPRSLSFLKNLLSSFLLDSFDSDYKMRCSFMVLYGQFGGK